MKIAFDYDDTIDLAYPFFSVITNSLIACGHEVYIVTDIMEEDRSFRTNQLIENNIAYTGLIITSDKLYECQKRGIEYIFDDCEDYYVDLNPVWLQLFSIPKFLSRTLSDGSHVEVCMKMISYRSLYHYRYRINMDEFWSEWECIQVKENKTVKNRLNNIKSQLGTFKTVNDLKTLWSANTIGTKQCQK